MNWIKTYPGGHSMNVVEQYPEVIKERSEWIELNWVNDGTHTLEEVIKILTSLTVYEYMHKPLNPREYSRQVLGLR